MIMYVHVYPCINLCMCAPCLPRPKEGISSMPLELDLQVVVTWVTHWEPNSGALQE